MSDSNDLVSQYMLDTRIQALGTGAGNVKQLDTSEVAALIPIPLPSSMEFEVFGANTGISGLDTTDIWIETQLVKSPPEILTRSKTGITRKRQDYILVIKANKEVGLYAAQTFADTVERHFENGLHLHQGNYLLTVLKSYQQPAPVSDSISGRIWNRIFVECETFYNNNN